MILGLGVDLCRVVRIRRSIIRFGKDWLDEVFTEEEQERLGSDDQRPYRVAVSFALKEACSKAIGTGFANGVQRQDFVISIAGSHCSIGLAGAAKRLAAKLSPNAPSFSIYGHFQLEHDYPVLNRMGIPEAAEV